MKKLYRLCLYIVSSPSNKGQITKRFFYAFMWQLWKRTYGRPIIITLDNGNKFVLDSNSSNSTGVIYTKVYEAEYVYFLREHFKDKTI